MKRKNKGKLILGLLIAVITLGIGYATISGVNLLINGDATVKPNGELKVRFVKNIIEETAIENPVENAITMSGKLADNTDMAVSNLSASVTNDTSATFAIEALESVGDYADFTYTVVNESEGIDALLAFDIATTNDAENYFEITKNVDKAIIGEGEIAKVTVRVKLIKSPRVTDVAGNFEITLTATPDETERNTIAPTDGTAVVTSTSTLAKAIQDDTVDKIEFGKNIVVSNNVNLAVTRDLTVDFNGYTLSVKPNSIKVEEGAELILEDTVGTGGISADKDVITVNKGGELTVKSGNYSTNEFKYRGAVITIPEGAENAKITIDGGTITGKYFGISVWADNSELIINNGTINGTASSVMSKDEDGKAYYAYAVRLSKGSLVMNGGTINGIHGGLGVIGTATATINDGAITLTPTPGKTDSFYCIYLEGNGSVRVNDGTFTNNGTNALVYTSSSNYADLYGGTYTVSGNNMFNGTDSTKIRVYGGTYNKDVDSYRQQ